LPGVSLRCSRTRPSLLSGSHSFGAATAGLLATKCAQAFDRFRRSARRSSSITVVSVRDRRYAVGDDRLLKTRIPVFVYPLLRRKRCESIQGPRYRRPLTRLLVTSTSLSASSERR
jgi:hypothetical protein